MWRKKTYGGSSCLAWWRIIALCGGKVSVSCKSPIKKNKMKKDKWLWINLTKVLWDPAQFSAELTARTCLNRFKFNKVRRVTGVWGENKRNATDEETCCCTALPQTLHWSIPPCTVEKGEEEPGFAVKADPPHFETRGPELVHTKTSATQNHVMNVGLQAWKCPHGPFNTRCQSKQAVTGTWAVNFSPFRLQFGAHTGVWRKPCALPRRKPGASALVCGFPGVFLGIAMARNSKTALGFQEWASSLSCLMKSAPHSQKNPQTQGDLHVKGIPGYYSDILK